MQLHQPRLAEMVASLLRDRILRGELKDGDALPAQDELLREFEVSKPSLREALGILEAEGLITVQRGNRGGAIVHVPDAAGAAYMIGLVMQFRGVPYSDLGDALKQLEPVCVALCAAREDRATEVLPHLKLIHEQTLAAVDDEVEFTRVTRRFHEALVQLCGNQTLILVAGALESLWSSQEQAWAAEALEAGDFPDVARRETGIRAHERIMQLIERGDAERLEAFARVHLANTMRYASTPGPVAMVSSRRLKGRVS
ncbi:FadR family transcriptional regulator [Actinomadura sp. KC216]|uniref:FadR/GntR family transcriptional regulator n=1 Tax=Actinomadura sp. KC216 TaxID=2530370 RepID=UPI001048489D|nr:FCD domain-containing protein [Actinomadura sp. KC216]TDB87219.1 FadR family transcriptional regulator [Actinomadura sp. KC216]